jgi:hypothetical protein
MMLINICNLCKQPVDDDDVISKLIQENMALRQQLAEQTSSKPYMVNSGYTHVVCQCDQCKSTGSVEAKLWLWKNGDHYLAYAHEYPCIEPGGDPLTLGNPIGYAIVKPSYGRDALNAYKPADDTITVSKAEWENMQTVFKRYQWLRIADNAQMDLITHSYGYELDEAIDQAIQGDSK